MQISIPSLQDKVIIFERETPYLAILIHCPFVLEFEMPAFSQSSHPTDSLSFRIRSGGERQRDYPFPVGPRRLTDTLIEFAIGGSWRVEDLDADVAFTTGSGRAFVVPAEHAHRLQMGKGPSMRTRWALIALEDEIGRDLLSQIPRAMALPAKSSLRVAEILLRLETQAVEGLAARLMIQRLGFELVSIVLQHSPAPPVKPTGMAVDRIEQVLRFIRDHLHEPLRRQDLARQAHLSATRFHYVFLDATGMAPMKYLTEQRIRRARQLLLSTALTSQEIGIQCGFESAPHFSRMFSRLTGVSPLQYRQQARQAE